MVKYLTISVCTIYKKCARLIFRLKSDCTDGATAGCNISSWASYMVSWAGCLASFIGSVLAKRCDIEGESSSWAWLLSIMGTVSNIIVRDLGMLKIEFLCIKLNFNYVGIVQNCNIFKNSARLIFRRKSGCTDGATAGCNISSWVS